MPRRKIVFVIVEGPTDDDALGVILSKIYNADTVYVKIVHGDITTDKNVNPTNIVSKIGNMIRDYAKRNHFKRSDFKRIIHITDTDGAYIPNSAVIYDSEATKATYSTTNIKTINPSSIIERNRRKRENIAQLNTTNEIWKLPYAIYYMSSNLDHTLYGKLNSTNEQKEIDAIKFANKYKDDIAGFLKFIQNSSFSVNTTYSDSWEYIARDFHSLERHTNFGLCFSDENKDEYTP